MDSNREHVWRGRRRLVVAALLVHGIAFSPTWADTPKGVYRMRITSVTTVNPVNPPPSCGKKIAKHLRTLSSLLIVYKSGVVVNDQDWILDLPDESPERGSTAAAHSPDSSKKLYVQIHFWVEKRKARGLLTFATVNATGDLSCADSREIQGTYETGT